MENGSESYLQGGDSYIIDNVLIYLQSIAVGSNYGYAICGYNLDTGEEIIYLKDTKRLDYKVRWIEGATRLYYIIIDDDENLAKAEFPLHCIDLDGQNDREITGLRGHE